MAGVNTAHSNSQPAADKIAIMKVHVTSETADAQHELEKARLAKKRQIRTMQYEEYRKTFYGSPVDKEKLRREHREALLGQVSRKEAAQKSSFKSRVKESEMAVAIDRACLEEDSMAVKTRAKYLQRFRDQNKQLIEMRACRARESRDLQNRRELELLQHDPINWSKTLV